MMSSFALSFKNEFYKLRHKKKFIIFLILGVLYCLVRMGGDMLISKVSGGTVTINTNLILSMLQFTVSLLVPIVVFMAATDLFATEFQEDTIKGSLTQPVTRFSLMFSKAAAIFALGAVYFFAMFLASFIIQIVSGAGLNKIPEILLAYILDLIPLICVIGLAVLINVLIKSPTLVMLALLVLYAVMMYLNYFSTAGQAIFTSYLQWHKLLIGTVIPFRSLILKIGILFGSALTLYSLAYIIFDNRDV